MQHILNAILPDLLKVVAAIAATAITMAFVALRNFITAKAGADNANHLIDLLHMALDTGVTAALAASPNASPQSIAMLAVAHAKASIPDTLAALAPSAVTLTNIALSKVFAATAPAAQ